MRINNENFKIDELTKKWDASGAISVYHKGECIYRSYYGLADREANKSINEESTYLINGASETLLAMSLLLLEDMKKINITDTLDKYLPEYANAHKITIKQLMQGASGIKDYLYEVIMPELENDENHNKLDDRARTVKEATIATENYTYSDVLRMVGDELEFEPGSLEEYNHCTTDDVFCKEIIERVSGMKLLDFEMKYILEPLNMNATKIGGAVSTKCYINYRDEEFLYTPIAETATDLLVTNFSDMEKLMLAIKDEKLLSQSAWEKALTFNADNAGLGFLVINNTITSMRIGLIGYGVVLYINKEQDLCYLNVSNADMLIKEENGKFTHLRRELRDMLDIHFTYPKNTKIVTYNETNWEEVYDMEIKEDQRDFVSEPKRCIAIAFAYKKDHQLFIEVEGNRPVGLVVLQVNKEAQIYYISQLVVDKHYQHRGYGKIMLKWAIEYLKEQGAKKLEIGVNRYNINAQCLYKSLGFVEAAVYESGMELKLEL